MLNHLDLLTLYLIGSGLLAALGLPLQRGWVPPNRWYGFRTKRTLSDREIWYAVNRVTGFWLLATGAATAASATIAHFQEIDLLIAACINAATYGVGLLLMAICSIVRLRNLSD
jgi:uncharacterized membrane protein